MQDRYTSVLVCPNNCAQYDNRGGLNSYVHIADKWHTSRAWSQRLCWRFASRIRPYSNANSVSVRDANLAQRRECLVYGIREHSTPIPTGSATARLSSDWYLWIANPNTERHFVLPHQVALHDQVNGGVEEYVFKCSTFLSRRDKHA